MMKEPTYAPPASQIGQQRLADPIPNAATPSPGKGLSADPTGRLPYDGLPDPITVPNRTTIPSTPDSGETAIYVDAADKRLATKDDTGLVRKMLEESSVLYRLIKVTEIFNGTTSYAPSSGADALFVECIAGGGAGGGVATAITNAGAGGGGGGGAYSCVFTTTIKSSYTVAIGAGGVTGGVGVGGAGGDTTFDSPSICTAKGGAGGAGDGVAAGPRIGPLGGLGGAAAAGVGDMKSNGDTGEAGIVLAAAQALSGKGAAGPIGGGGGLQVKAQANGNAGLVFGAGGSGAVILSGGANTGGGAGANGVLRVWEFQAVT